MSIGPAILYDVTEATAAEHTIADLAALHGVSYRTLRFYEQKGLLRPSRRGAQRVFSDADRVRLDGILLAKRLGFALSEIRDLIDSLRPTPAAAPDEPPSVASLGLSKQEIDARVAQLTRKRADVQQAIDELRQATPGLGAAASSETSSVAG